LAYLLFQEEYGKGVKASEDRCEEKQEREPECQRVPDETKGALLLGDKDSEYLIASTSAPAAYSL
jgi:hypothetical protein